MDFFSSVLLFLVAVLVQLCVCECDFSLYTLVSSSSRIGNSRNATTRNSMEFYTGPSVGLGLCSACSVLLA